MNPAKVFIQWFLTAFRVGPQPEVEKLTEPEFMDRLWENHRPIALVVIAVSVTLLLIILGAAAWVFIPDSSLAR